MGERVSGPHWGVRGIPWVGGRNVRRRGDGLGQSLVEEIEVGALPEDAVALGLGEVSYIRIPT